MKHDHHPHHRHHQCEHKQLMLEQNRVEVKYSSFHKKISSLFFLISSLFLSSDFEYCFGHSHKLTRKKRGNNIVLFCCCCCPRLSTRNPMYSVCFGVCHSLSHCVCSVVYIDVHPRPYPSHTLDRRCYTEKKLDPSKTVFQKKNGTESEPTKKMIQKGER